MRWFFVPGLILAWATTGQGADTTMPLRDGDRVVLIGDTLIERAQQYGFLETELLSRFPHTKVTFRNLGWSGDTVRGLSRGYFDGPDVAQQRQTEQVTQEKPTLLIIGYGMAESFDGPAGLPAFRGGLVDLLGRIDSEKQRVLLLSPIHHEDLGAPLPDPTAHNAALAAYSETIAAIAQERSAPFVDLYSWSKSAGPAQLTDNGIHLSPAGYWLAALEITRQLQLPPQAIEVQIDAAGNKVGQKHAQVKLLKSGDNGVKFEQTDARLPTPAFGEADLSHAQQTTIELQVTGLKSGNYELLCDGRQIARGSAQDWARGVNLIDTPQHRQVEKLRQLVLRKNQLFFAKYRPQNITYLLGFRRHEQGQNAKELEQLAQLVQKLEAEIDATRIPATHTFELKPAAP